jgi:hypothetical protein
MKTFVKILRWVGICLGALVVALFALYIVLDIKFGIELRHVIRDLKAQGKPMTIAEIIPPPVPDNENAAGLLNKAFVLMTTGEGGEPYIPNRSLGKVSKTVDSIREPKSYSDISLWTDEQRARIPETINSPEMQQIFAVLEEASRRPKCNFDLEYEKGPMMLLPHLAMMRNTARMLSVKACLEAQSGDYEKAFRTVLVGLRIAEHLREEPILISQLVRIAYDVIMINCIESTSDVKHIPLDAVDEIIGELSKHGDVAPFAKTCDGEKVCFGIWTFERFLRGEYKDFAMIVNSDKFINPTLKSRLIWKIRTLLYRPVLKKDLATYLLLTSGTQEAFREPYSSGTEQTLSSLIEWIPRYCMVTRTLMPAYDKLRTTIAEYQANIEICRVGLALEIYKHKNGKYPETLASLSPGIMENIPVDPFTGKNLIYLPADDGFVLYSVGPNMKDDNGTPKSGSSRGNHDIVWRCQK